MFERNKAVEDAFKRVVETNASATDEQRLGRRTSSALDKLLTYTSLNPLTVELASLESTTRLSPESCLTLAESNALQVLMKVVKECNRSEPHKKIILFSMGIFLNLSKFDRTLPELLKCPDLIDYTMKVAYIHIRDEEVLKKCLTLLLVLLKADPTLIEEISANLEKRRTLNNIVKFLKREKERVNWKPASKSRNQNNGDISLSPEWAIASRNGPSHRFTDKFSMAKVLFLLFQIPF
jgi:hypothetical protein